MERHSWLACGEPQRMINLLTRTPGAPPDNAGWRLACPAGDRKLRLIACAWFHEIESGGYRMDDHNRAVIAKVEDDSVAIPGGRQCWGECLRGDLAEGLGMILRVPSLANETAVSKRRQCEVVRDIVGDPWNPVAVSAKLRCRNGHDALVPVKKNSYPVPLSSCLTCFEEGPPWPDVVAGEPVPWLTPLVRDLAEAAYQFREGWQGCGRCGGKGEERYCDEAGDMDGRRCPACHGVGHADGNTGRLDPVRLAVLADALVDAGMPEEIECRADRCYEGQVPYTPRGPGGQQMLGVACGECAGTGRVPHPILASLRSPTPHYRGLWSLDSLLGKG